MPKDSNLRPIERDTNTSLETISDNGSSLNPTAEFWVCKAVFKEDSRESVVESSEIGLKSVDKRVSINGRTDGGRGNNWRNNSYDALNSINILNGL